MADIRVYGASWCPDCKRAKKFLGEHRVAYDWIDIDEDQDGLAYVEKLQDGGRSIPTVVFADGSHLLEPSNEELARKLGLKLEAQRGFYDVAIVEQRLTPRAAFVFVGLQPNTDFLRGAVDLDRSGFLSTDARFRTSMPGVFAAGDVRAGATKQLGAAVGEGITALLMVREHLREHHHLATPQAGD
jgi:glutaredoxin-like protein